MTDEELKAIEAESAGDCSNCMLLVREVRRLKALVSKVEVNGPDLCCPWCEWPRMIATVRHSKTCPAFTQGGDAR